jgi:hypothetical protein
MTGNLLFTRIVFTHLLTIAEVFDWYMVTCTHVSMLGAQLSVAALKKVINTILSLQGLPALDQPTPDHNDTCNHVGWNYRIGKSTIPGASPQ